MITLPIKKQWFDLIDNGIKKEEYREITPRYKAMFNNALDENGCFWCRLRNGYSSASPTLEVYVHLSHHCHINQNIYMLMPNQYLDNDIS